MTTYWNLVERRAAEAPDALVVADDSGSRLTASALRDRAEELAYRLGARGVAPGDRVSWILPSSADAVVLICALARLGAVQNPIVPIYGEPEVTSVTHQVGTKLLITPGTFRKIDFTAMGRAVGERVGFDVVELSELDAGPLQAMPAPTDSDAVRWVFTTSGTTADPKCVQHSDRTMIAAGIAIESCGLQAGSRWGGAIPITHIGGPTVLALALTVGASMHFIQVLDPVDGCEALRDWGCDVVAGVGMLVTAMLEFQRGHTERRFPELRVIAAGGGPKLPGLLERVSGELGCDLVPSYGMTECPYVAGAWIDDPIDARAEGEGKPSRGVEVRIVGEDGTVRGPGEEGEIRARGPQLFLGYVDSALDADALDDEGYFKTGDLGYLAPEGHLVVTGRLKEMIIRNGENLSVRPIEDLLLQHSGIADVTVIGLPHPTTGECVCAVVVARDGATLKLDDLRAFCQERGLMRQKLPERLELVDQIPRNPMGKAIKPELRRRFSS